MRQQQITVKLNLRFFRKRLFSKKCFTLPKILTNELHDF
jgi:hypothetical protein